MSEVGAARWELRESTLHLGGRLSRLQVGQLWQSLPRQGYSVMDICRVEHLDTAGLALLLELADAVAGKTGTHPRIVNATAAYDSLCAAYRLS